jgi:hypothetical protein
MKTRWIVMTTVALALILVAGLAGAGWWFVGRNVWGGVVQAQGPRGNGFGSMMGGGSVPAACSRTTPLTPAGQPLTIQQAKEAAERYVASLGYSNLRVAEVMEFSQNYYALVQESDTGIGAMELLIDKGSGAVGPEYGPNMMWNAKYGMHRGGMMGGMMGGRTSGAMTITPAEARQIAQRWLDTYRPGATPEAQPDAFYGYYTIHTLKDGKINGMLSVNGSDGQVWYHTWHGDFLQMIAEEG